MSGKIYKVLTKVEESSWWQWWRVRITECGFDPPKFLFFDLYSSLHKFSNNILCLKVLYIKNKYSITGP